MTPPFFFHARLTPPPLFVFLGFRSPILRSLDRADIFSIRDYRTRRIPGPGPFKRLPPLFLHIRSFCNFSTRHIPTSLLVYSLQGPFDFFFCQLRKVLWSFEVLR